MPVRRKNAIGKADFEDALDYLGASISQIAQESGIPRAYLSDLRNRNISLRREYEEKLRAYLQEKQVEFEGDQNTPASTCRPPHPALTIGTATRCYFPIAEKLPDETVEQAMAMKEINDARLDTLLGQQAQREDGLFSGLIDEPDFDQATKDAQIEFDRLCAENYLLVRMLCGWRALRMSASAEGKKTIGDLVNEKNLPLFIEAGFFQAEIETDPEEETEPA